MVKIFLFWDGATEPSGWTLESGQGGLFYQKFIRGSDVFGGTGGATTHTHSATVTNFSYASSSRKRSGSLYSSFCPTNHTHNVNSTSISSESNLPPYRTLKVISYNGIPSTLPAGIIAIFDSTPPAGWTRYSAQDGYYIMGDANAGTTGGSLSHSHNISGNVSQSSASTNGYKYGATVADNRHTHSFSGTSDSASNEPPYIEVILAKADSDTSIPQGLIAMFDGDPGVGWTVLSNSGGAFYQKFIKPSVTYGGTGGTVSHTHTASIITSGPSKTYYDGVQAGTALASNSHTHTIDFNLSSSDHLPPYIDVIFAKKTQVIYSLSLSFTVVYDLFTILSSQFNLLYDLFKTISQSSSLNYDILSSITVNELFRYDLRVALQGQYSITYDVLTSYSAKLDMRYSLFEKIIDSFVFDYSILRLVEINFAIKYDLLLEFQKYLPSQYDVFVKLKKYPNFNYNIFELITSSKDLVYSNFTALVTQSSFDYDVFNIRISRLTGVYSIQLQQLLKVLIINYDVRRQLFSQLSTNYDLFSKVLTDFSIVYDVFQLALSKRSLPYNILVKTIVLSNTIYDILESQRSDLITKYDLFKLSLILSTFKYDITPHEIFEIIELLSKISMIHELYAQLISQSELSSKVSSVIELKSKLL